MDGDGIKGEVVHHIHEQINKVIRLFGFTRFLEIGPHDNDVFFNVDCQYKAAINEVADEENRPLFEAFEGYFPLSARDFYRNLPFNPVFQKFRADDGSTSWDFVYLNNPQNFEQAWSDFVASIQHVHEMSVWLIENTVPEVSSPTLANGPVHDVFKVVFAVHDLIPDISYATLMTDHGTPYTLLWKSREIESRLPVFGNIERIRNLSLADFLIYARLLMPVETEDDLFSLVGKSLNPERRIRETERRLKTIGEVLEITAKNDQNNPLDEADTLDQVIDILTKLNRKFGNLA